MRYLLMAAMAFASCGHEAKCITAGGMLLKPHDARMSCEALQRAESQALAAFASCPRLRHDFTGLIIYQHATDAWTDVWGRRVGGLAFCRTAKTPTNIEVGQVDVVPHEMAHIALGCALNHDWQPPEGLCCETCTQSIHDAVLEASTGLGQ